MTTAIDGSKPLNGTMTFISETANSITVRIAAGSVLSTQNNIPILLQMNARSVSSDSTLFDEVFTELTNRWDKLYVKDSGISQTIYTEVWDRDNNFGRVWIILDQLTTAQKDLVIEFDNTSVVNVNNKWIGLQKYIYSYADYYEYSIFLSPTYYYRLGESIGQTVAIDEMGIANGTYIGAPILEHAGLLVGDLDTSIDCNGVGWVDIPGITEFVDPIKPFSVSFLVSANALTNDGFLTLPGTATTDGLVIWMGTTGYGTLAIGNAGTDWGRFHAEPNRIVDTTYHYVITYDGNNPTSTSGFKFYENGILLVTSVSGNYNAIACANLEIGNMSEIAGRILPAVMDEVLLFDNKELIQEEVTELYNLSI